MRIAITQRVEQVEDRGERRDCLDQAWPTRLEAMGYHPVPVPNALDNPAGWAKTAQIDGLLLTGGNDLSHLPEASNPAPERDRTEQALLDFAAEQSLPVVAHCRGLQMMNVYLGGTLSRCSGHVATRHQIRWRGDNEEESSEVNSYHNWGVMKSDLAGKAEVLAVADDGSVEAFRHRELPWLALMWHPEREPSLTSLDRRLITECFAQVQTT